jgi:hypothetical protein
MVEEVYNLFTYAAAEKGLRYTYSVSHKIPKNIFGDIESVKNAFSVLVKIAIDDCKSGVVELTVDPTSISATSCTVKFSINENSMKVPYWFAVSFQVPTDPLKLRKIS